MKDQDLNKMHSPNRGKDRLPIILSYARDYEQMIREERGASVDAEIVRALIQARDRVQSGKLAIKEIAEVLNADRPERENFTNRAVSNFLSTLGFRRTHIHGGRAAIFYDVHLIKSRAGQFGLFDELKQMDEEQPPNVEGLGGDNVTVEWLVDIDTGDVNQPNQPTFERFLGKGKKFSKGQRSTIDPEAANVLSMMGTVKIRNEID
ncbi:hypothetical protein ES703_31674 [subsurface metagenome]